MKVFDCRERVVASGCGRRSDGADMVVSASCAFANRDLHWVAATWGIDRRDSLVAEQRCTRECVLSYHHQDLLHHYAQR